MDASKSATTDDDKDDLRILGCDLQVLISVHLMFGRSFSERRGTSSVGISEFLSYCISGSLLKKIERG